MLVVRAKPPILNWICNVVVGGTREPQKGPAQSPKAKGDPRGRLARLGRMLLSSDALPSSAILLSRRGSIAVLGERLDHMRDIGRH